MADLKTTMDIVFGTDKAQSDALNEAGNVLQQAAANRLLRSTQAGADQAIKAHSNKRFQELDIKARYNQLPEFLTLEEIAYLMNESIEPFVEFMKKTGLKTEYRKVTKAYGNWEVHMALHGLLGDEFAHKTEFKNWLQSMNKWPIDGPLANWWKEDKPEPNANPTTDEVQNSKRKKLIPLERETTESLLLIYRIAESIGIEFLDQLPPPKAWGLIVSGKFTDDLIKKHPINDKGELVLNSGETLSKKGFTDKYRSRFKAQT